MKAQFALTESIIAVLILAIASYSVSFSVYAASTHNPDQEYPTFFYDFLQAAYHNRTFGSCLAYANGSCTSILQRLAGIYGMAYIKIENGFNGTSYGSPASCVRKALLCAPVKKGALYSISCIYICGD